MFYTDVYFRTIFSSYISESDSKYSLDLNQGKDGGHMWADFDGDCLINGSRAYDSDTEGISDLYYRDSTPPSISTNQRITNGA